MISCRELRPSDLEAVFDLRVKTWHNPSGAGEMCRLGITPEAVLAIMEHFHRGWVAEDEHRIVNSRWVIGKRARCGSSRCSPSSKTGASGRA
jgi:hypothetical protein